jgi:hypothetical protein
MSNETTYSGILGEWQRLDAALAANVTSPTWRRAARCWRTS